MEIRAPMQQTHLFHSISNKCDYTLAYHMWKLMGLIQVRKMISELAPMARAFFLGNHCWLRPKELLERDSGADPQDCDMPRNTTALTGFAEILILRHV